jgi:tRNA A-37 threonylcarbamoyl transferase component Bud32
MPAAPDSANPPVSGLVAGKFEVVGLIGRGGMGSVWEGRHATLGTRVAIKFIDLEYADSPEARTRFLNEARAAATIQSKHAIQIHDHGVTEEGRPYIVMELLLGEPLDKRLDRMGRLSLQETARMMVQVCRALQRAHDAGIIHRDLKPENIFLVRSHDDDDEIAKVLDFGIAKIKGPPGGAGGLTSSTKTGAVLGTPYYMSPEQARGLRNIDHRTDLWSLGVIAYKCVTGVLPFEGESVGDLLVKICTSPHPTPSLSVPGLPPAFDAWFFRALEREPQQRFSTAQELADSLAFAAGLSVRRGPMSSQPEHRMAQQQASSGQVAISPPAYGVTPDGAYLATTPHGTPAVHPQQMGVPAAGVTSAPFTAPAEPPRSSRGVLFGVLAAAIVGGVVGVFAVVHVVRTGPGAVVNVSTPGIGVSVQPSAGTNTLVPPPPLTSADTSSSDVPPLTTASHGKPPPWVPGTRTGPPTTKSAATAPSTAPTPTSNPTQTPTTKPTSTFVGPGY